MNLEIEQILIDDIDADFRKFKISRNHFSENLTDSIKKYGIINPAYLLKNSNGYNAVFGHNRIECAKICGLKTIPSLIDNSIDEKYFLNQSVIKIFNNEIGPSGKIKLIKILSDELNFPKDKIEALCNDFSIPSYIFKTENFKKFMSMPEELLSYIDSRDVQFKIIDKILKLENKITEILSLWADKTIMKLNLFKSIVDMLFDLQKNGINPDDLNKISPENYDDRNTAVNLIHDRIFALRYPLYFEMLKKSDKIRNSMAGNKIIAEIPKYFESGFFYIKIPVDKKSGYLGLKNKFDSVKQNDINEILELL
jgi:hypothetical protein